MELVKASSHHNLVKIYFVVIRCSHMHTNTHTHSHIHLFTTKASSLYIFSYGFKFHIAKESETKTKDFKKYIPLWLPSLLKCINFNGAFSELGRKNAGVS